MTPPELGPRRAVLHCLPNQFPGVGVGLQQSDHVAADLTDVVVLDSATQTGQEAWADRLDIRLAQGDQHVAVIVDGHGMCRDVFLADDADSIVDTELPVVPGARDEVAVERTLGHPIALMRAGVGKRRHSIRCPDQAEAMVVDADHLHRADRQVVESGDDRCVA